MKPRKWRILCCILFILALVCAGVNMLLDIPDPYYILEGLLIILVLGIFVSCILFWRCPKCKKLLPLFRFYAINACPFCGADLDE